jgi:hypothetical protein
VGPNEVMRGRKESCHNDICPRGDCILREIHLCRQREGPAAYGYFPFLLS